MMASVIRITIFLPLQSGITAANSIQYFPTIFPPIFALHKIYVLRIATCYPQSI